MTTTVQIPRKENIERFFTRVFDTYVANNRNQVLVKPKKALMEEVFVDFMHRNEARTKAKEHLSLEDINGQCADAVTSTTDD